MSQIIPSRFCGVHTWRDFTFMIWLQGVNLKSRKYSLYLEHVEGLKLRLQVYGPRGLKWKFRGR